VGVPLLRPGFLPEVPWTLDRFTGGETMSEQSERIINSARCECIAERSEAIA